MKNIISWLQLILTAFFSALGAFMAFASEFLSNLPSELIPWLEATIQLIGIALFMFAVFYYMVTSQYREIKRSNSIPRLVMKDPFIEFKRVHREEPIRARFIGEYDIVNVNIANEPGNWEGGRPAEKATAEMYVWKEGENKRHISYGRWWDRDIPLFPNEDFSDIEKIKQLKQIDINPGHPETLVLGHFIYGMDTFHAFYYMDYKEIENLYDERVVGKLPINFDLYIRGRFKLQRFRFVLDRDGDEQLIIRKSPNWLFRMVDYLRRKVDEKRNEKAKRQEKETKTAP